MGVFNIEFPYLFISYAHKDSETVSLFIKAMQNTGFRLRFDQGIEADTEWPKNIAAHLIEAEAVVVFMSPNTVAYQNCRNEINPALSFGYLFPHSDGIYF